MWRVGGVGVGDVWFCGAVGVVLLLFWEVGLVGGWEGEWCMLGYWYGCCVVVFRWVTAAFLASFCSCSSICRSIMSTSFSLLSSSSLSLSLLYWVEGGGLTAIYFPFPRDLGVEELRVYLRGSGLLHWGWVEWVAGWEWGRAAIYK